MNKKALAVVLVLALFFSAAVVLHTNNSASYLASVSSSTGWKQTYGGDDWDQVEAVIQTSDGGYALAGRTKSFGSGGYEFWLVKTDSLGNVEWNRSYGSGSAYYILQTSDGGYVIGGTKLVKTDSEGNIQWKQTYGETLDRGYSLIQTSDGGYALAGTSTVIIDDDLVCYYAWLIKTDPEGNIPEFPSWTIVPLVVATTLITIYFKKRVSSKSTLQFNKKIIEIKSLPPKDRPY